MNNDLVQQFKRLFDHRTGILEGVRAVAFRNIDHLTRAMRREGIDRFTTPASMVCVQDAMVRDQGLDPTPMNRWLLSCGTFNAWEIYLCLLFAEVESYSSMRNSCALPTLDELINRNTPVFHALKTMRDKLLHPTKDVPFETTLTQYFGKVEQRYPTHFLFAKHLQTLLDRYLRSLWNHLAHTLAHDVARLPDNELHAFLTQGELDLRRALARANNTINKRRVEKLLQDHLEFARNRKLGSRRRDDPLDKEQGKRVRRLHDVKMTLIRSAPLPTTDYHFPTAVQAPFHETLFSYIPTLPEPETQGFYRGALLPPYLLRARRDHVTLVFRSTLLFSESLHNIDAILRNHFPGKSRSEIMELKDWPTKLPIPATLREIVTVATWVSPSIVALALLADPLRVYRSVIVAKPELSIVELCSLATDDNLAKLFAWRNTVFHVPDKRIANPYRLAKQLLDISPYDKFRELISGLWRFFLPGDALRDAD